MSKSQYECDECGRPMALVEVVGIKLPGSLERGFKVTVMLDERSVRECRPSYRGMLLNSIRNEILEALKRGLLERGIEG